MKRVFKNKEIPDDDTFTRNEDFPETGKKSKARKFFKALLIFFVICFVAGASFYIIEAIQAPALDSVSAVPEGYLSVVNDKDGNEILTLHDSESNRVYITLDQIPDNMKNAFVAIEDSRFYSHHGVDFKGIARAFVKGVLKGFHFSQGASTITQQLIKNNVLTSWTSETTFFQKVCRKTQEIHLALALERKYDKDWILENYLNTINLGGTTRGVQTASQFYFGKDPSGLTLAQCALIAGITKNPSGYNPFKYPDACLTRQHLVLEAMKDQGYITEDEYDTAMAEDVISELDSSHGSYAETEVFSYFEDELLETVVDDLCAQLGLSEADAWNMIYTGGLTINSTEDSDLQKICEEQVQNDSLYTSNEEVSVVMTDVTTGAVLAMVGGREEKTASLSFNRATDSERQPGSIIKVIGEYAAGLDTGAFTLGTVYDDAPMTYKDGTAFKDAYKEYKGLITVRDAITYSSNTVAVMTYDELGYDKVMEYIRKFGITTLENESPSNEALSIGGTSGGVTNLEMTAAYNAIANGGYYTKPYYYTTVTDHEGKIILQNDVTGERVISEDTAKLLTSAMESVMAEGTGTKADFSGMDLAGKSGTTNDNKDLWFMGYSPYYTCGVWGGFDDNSEQSGSSYVKVLWRNIMQAAVKAKGQSYTKLTRCEGLESASICIKCGKLATDGLCNDTVQGDMTSTEYFKNGTVPTSGCDCHEAVQICSESGELASEYCPEEDVTTSVYLKEGSADTADADYSINNLPVTTCSIHTGDWWNQLQQELQNQADEAENKLDEWGNQINEWSNEAQEQWNEWFGNGDGSSDGSGDGAGSDYGQDSHSGGDDSGSGHASGSDD